MKPVMKFRAIFPVLAAFFAPCAVLTAAGPPAPYGALPDAAQLAWHDLEMYAFAHFTVNTFTDKEWGYGNEDPKLFNPTDFSADQIVGTLAETGFKGLIITAKHHDGFCLWPTKTTKHSVASSPWKNGKGDMVREFSEACRRHGIKFGVYLSPWDRNNPHYGTPKYIEIYRAQLRELLTNYGPIFEVWFDGANGGDGYYGGARERRNIDRTTYYDWPTTWAMVRKLQPGAVIFSDVGPGCRWIGNERGKAGYPCWATITPRGKNGKPPGPGEIDGRNLPTGTPDGKFWIPGEVDVSIRPGWFYHASQDKRVRTPRNLLDLYFTSVARGASLLLNVPPDRRGRIHENDVAALRGFKKTLDEMFAKNLADGAAAHADSIRGEGFGPARVLDGSRKSYWAARDGATKATLTLDLPGPRTFSVVRLREAVALGQRVRRFAVDVRENGNWRPWFPEGSSIGAQTLLRGKPTTADGVRVRILEAAASPCLSEVSLWLEPKNVPGARIAKAHPTDPMALPKNGWKIAASFETKDHPAAAAIDGDPRTFWCTHDSAKGEMGPPQSLTIDLGAEHDLAAITVLPRQDGTAHAVVDRYRVEWSRDGKIWSKPLEGEFSNIRANPVEQRIALPEGAKARHIRFTALRVLEKNNVTVAEISVIRRK
jgi:alpha-L-fucosidase